MIDEHSSKGEPLTISDGVKRLRAGLRTPKKCIRLIGLSGVGKTRLVEALFESGLVDDPLDSGLAVYTDYSVETNPTARDMAYQLVQDGQRAILIIDNCNPNTHTDLVRICTYGVSNVSLLTVEYDVRDDEPEQTNVFRLQSASSDLVVQWLEKLFPDISEIDRRTIAKFSDGNFRVARALAQTFGKGETLSKLNDCQIFERIFYQRNQPDRKLQSAAEDLSLLYSVDGEDTSGSSELAKIANIRRVSASDLYAELAELRDRGVVQERGKWSAILPPAIANRLATRALERIPSADLDSFSASLPYRMQKSLSRRLGYLHDSPYAQKTVIRWLQSDGPLGDLVSRGKEGVEILSNIAPVAPTLVLEKLNYEINSSRGEALLSVRDPTRGQWIRLIKALSYEPDMFETAAMLLVRFLAVEPLDNKWGSAREVFIELFYLHRSGIQSTPEQRRAFVKQLANSEVREWRHCASLALGALLKSHYSILSSSFDFGARSRDWGWSPKFNQDVWDWYSAAIDLAVELSPVLDDARRILAGSVSNLWHYSACHDVLDRAVVALVKVKPWTDGWIAFRILLRFQGRAMPDPVRQRLETIIQRLEPPDLLHQARAVVLNRTIGGGCFASSEPDDGDVMKPWQKAAQMAQEVGLQLAQDSETRKKFLTELMAEPRAHRAFDCGRGLAEGASDLSEMWCDLTGYFNDANSRQCNVKVLGGFIYQAHLRDEGFALASLEGVIDNPALASVLPYLQARVGIDEEGIMRLRRAIRKDVVKADDFCCIANGEVGDSPPEPLGALLLDIAGLVDGVEIALDILHMRFFCDHEAGRSPQVNLIELGRTFLCRLDVSRISDSRDYGLHTIIHKCCSGDDGEATAREVCMHICDAMEKHYFSLYNLKNVLNALFETQPVTALDMFLLSMPVRRNCILFEMDFDSPVESINPEVLRHWAEDDPVARYPFLGQAISMFKRKSEEDGEEVELLPLFLAMLDHAPDKRVFFGDLRMRMYPRGGWIGSLARILERRRDKMLTLRDSQHPDVCKWVADMIPKIDDWISKERDLDRQVEESFE